MDLRIHRLILILLGTIAMTSLPTRRQFTTIAAGAALSLAVGSAGRGADKDPSMLIIDTHQHLWDLDKLRLPWLEKAKEPLGKSFLPADYQAAVQGLHLRSVYMEVDVAVDQQVDEAKYVLGLCRDASQPTKGAVVGGRPASPDFAKYLDTLLGLEQPGSPSIKGVRQVLHSEVTKSGFCLTDEFVRGVKLLGERKLSFDLCLRPTELADGIRLTEKCPGTRFVLDHCGNADPKAFGKFPAAGAPEHDADQWKRDLAAFAKRPNAICKISGIVARAPAGWKPADLAPIVNHCLDSFGPDRVVFGSDWPVCLLGAPLRQWIDALAEIIASRPAADQRKLWSGNAVKFYGLTV